MEEIYVKRQGKTDEPHRHDFFTVIIVKQAKGIHKIDFNAYELGKNQIFFVSPGQVHQIIEHEPSTGYALTFSTQFLVENAIHISFIESLNLFHDYGQSPPLTPSAEQFSRVEQFAEEIYALHHSNAQMKMISIGAFLKLIFIECNNSCEMDPTEWHQEVSTNQLVRAFKEKVNAYYKNEHSTTFYAEQIHVTPDHLNRVIKSTIGKTAKEYIQSKIITEAKRLLFFSTLTNKEIGFELGFNEPANFSAFFKKCTQLSPSKFKEKEHLA